ncbi:DUF6049 family protein [Gryllotalpicola ginsengisoli]|uniref:DUF6049 family protein n=1 Tax=Gryllotalpicola ginsengisoli TaxID=444608 RepID=UPI0003B5D5FA|nr:DUF6049 family protein [Gryllotalpicola ginsengisoli]
MRLAGALVAILLCMQALVASPAPAHAATDSASAPTVQVFADDAGRLSGKQSLSVTVVVKNPGSSTIEAGTVSVQLTRSAITSRTALAAWQKSPGSLPRRTLASAATDAVPPGATLAVATLTVPASKVKLSGKSAAVYGLSATVKTDAGSLGTGTGTVVWRGSSANSLGVAVVMPLTVPARSDGLIGSNDLATYTAPGGLLTRELQIAQQTPSLTLGIDPMILASIRVLGSSAPQSAQDWLSSLAALSNPSFPLQYADADPALESQAGLSRQLTPISFDYAMDPGDHGSPLTVGESTDSPTPSDSDSSATPSPSPTSSSKLPTTAELLDWPYTLGGIAWPAAGEVRQADVQTFARGGLTTTILSGSNTNAASLTGTPNTVLPVSGGTALVADDGISAALTAAMRAADPLEQSSTRAALEAQLTLAAGSATDGGVVLAALDRFWPADVGAAVSALELVAGSGSTHVSSLRDALVAPRTTGLQLVDHKASASRISLVERLIDREGDERAGSAETGQTIAQFSSVLQQPSLLTAPTRNELLSLLAVGWTGSADWSTAVTKNLSKTAEDLSAVQIVAPGKIHQLSSQALIPITVTNRLDHPVEVRLRTRPSSPLLEIDTDTDRVIPADSSANVLVPVKAQLGNGTVWLDLQLYSRSGVPIGSAKGASVDVRADWEGIGALALGVLIVGFFAFGLVRSIRRRRREKRAALAPTGEGEGADG